MRGQIIRLIAGNYGVMGEDKIRYECRASAKLRYEDKKPLVGDFVDFMTEDSYITTLHPRKNSMVRPAIANVDQALVIMSCKEPNFSSYLLNKLLVIIKQNNVDPVIVFTKTDLDEGDIDSYVKDYEAAGYKVFKTNKHDESTFDPIIEILKDKTTVLAGQTGAGKSTLTNKLDIELNIPTQEISKALGRGKHTTRHVELHAIGGGLLADTPGFSSFELVDTSKEDMAVGFYDFAQLKKGCKFNDCIHQNEPGCKVKEAVKNGTIPQYRYDDYLKMMDEVENKKERY